MADEDSKKRYTNLEQMSTEDLESILRTAALMGEEIEPDLMDRILEVIVKREENKEENKFPDVKQAREEFDQLYRNLKEPLYPIEPSEESSSQAQIPFQTASKRKRDHLLLRVAIVAAILAVAMTLPVFGHESIFQIVAQWTAEQFSFRPSGALPSGGNRQSEPVPEEYAELQAALHDNGIERVIVPRYIPEGFQAEETFLYDSPETGAIKFDIVYEAEDNYIHFSAHRVTNHSELIYEKDDNNVDPYLYSGVEHFIFSNNGENISAWYVGEIEYAITTRLSVLELKQIINSMY